MANVTVVAKVVKVTMTANDWELYTSMRGSNVIAQNLNRHFEKLVREGKTATEVYSEMSALMSKYAEYGASDSEPRYHLNCLIRKVFPESNW